MILKKTQPIINAFKYLIITLSINYKNNMLYFFSHYKIGFIIISEKKR